MQVRLSAMARRQLAQMKDWIEDAADSETAGRFVDEIVRAARALSDFPYRSPRPELRPGLRSVSFRRNVTILYRVTDDTVVIVAVRYAGQDWSRLLQDR
ncbi:MAG: type II toxin-antitoxin system RelE/ParE family toxin [Sandarakinorhabdus sp.]